MNPGLIVIIALIVVVVIASILIIRRNAIADEQNNTEPNDFGIQNPPAIIYRFDEVIQPTPPPISISPTPGTPTVCNEIVWNVIPGAPSRAWRSSLFIPELNIIVYGSSDLTNSIAITTVGSGIYSTPNTPRSAVVLIYSPTLGNGQGRIVAAGFTSTMFSDDAGLTWSLGQGFPLATNTQWSSGAWSDDLGLFVIGTNTGVIGRGDGSFWTTVTRPSNTQSITSMIWTTLGGGKFIGTQFDQGAPSGTGYIISSNDGNNWTRHSLTGVPQTNWFDFAYSPELGMIMMVGAFGPSIATTTSDPTLDDWTYSTGSGETGQTVVWASGCQEFVSSTFSSHATSPDGINWTNRGLHGVSGQITMAYVPSIDTIVSAGFNGALAEGNYI